MKDLRITDEIAIDWELRELFSMESDEPLADEI